MIDPRFAWFAIGATCSAVVFGWPWHPRFSRFSHENTAPDSSEARPRKFHNICNDDHRLDSVALWRPVRFDEGPTARNTSRHAPVAPKPRLIPRGTRSITFPDPSPDRQPTNPFTGKLIRPKSRSPRIFRKDFLP